MKVRLLRDTRVIHRAGDVVEITDPALLANLFSTRSAEALGAEAPENPERETAEGVQGATGKPPAKRTTSRKK